MNVNMDMNKMIEINNINQIKNSPAVTMQGIPGFDNLRFDSILNSISSNVVSKGMEQYHNDRAGETNNTFEKSENHTAMNNQNKDRGYDDMNRSTEKSERDYQSDNSDNKYGSSKIDERQKVDEGYETEERYEDVETETIENEARPEGSVEQEEQDHEITENDEYANDQSAAVNGEVSVENDDQLVNMLNEEGLISAALIDNNQSPVQKQDLSGDKSAETLSNNNIANAVKDAELAAMLQNINSELNVNAESNEDGPGMDAVLSALKGKNQQEVNMQENAEPVIDENADAIEAEKALTELDNLNEAETDDQLKATESQNKVKTEGKNVNSENQLFTEQVKNLKKDSGDNVAKGRENSKNPVNNMESKQDIAEELRLMENSEANEVGDNNDAAEFSERLLSAFSQNNNSESGLKNSENKSVKPLRVSSANNSLNVTGASDISQGSGKLNSVLQTGTVSRPAGLEVVDKIVYVNKGNNKLDVTLEHKEFGKLKIEISLEKGTIHVNINTPDKVVKDFVENNLQQIIDSMEKDGLDVGGFSVALKDQKGNDQFGEGSKNNRYSSSEKENVIDETNIKEVVRNSNGNLSVFA